MKLKFDPSLEYQRHAIEAVVDVFDGQPMCQSGFGFGQISGGLGLVQSELAIGNAVTLTPEKILENVRAIQERNEIERVCELQGMDFSIEMETGTGKTYVYLRTIFELNKVYGFKKFIIVVPSIAIREGVLKSIEMMEEHFRTLYDNVPFKPFVYDSKRLEKVNAFAKDNSLQIMIINIQSFQRDANIFNQEHERSYGYRPSDLVKAARPILIIDEPQNTEGERSAEAIRNLEPVATLRYSATHKNFYNLLYKLDPVRAYDLRLVKQIEVASIRSDDSYNDAYVKLLKTDNSNGIKAQVEIYKAKPNGDIRTSKVWVKQGEDLFLKSGEVAHYREGYVVQNIDCTPDAAYVEFSRGKFLGLAQEMGGMGDEIMKAQVYEAVEQHLKKERALKGKGIKVLTLFFIDKVASYRVYNADGSSTLGKVGQWFEEAFGELSAKAHYAGLIDHPVEKLHNGYFSQDRQGRAKDTSGSTKDDEDTYSLIMREKERLLDPDEPLRFIFSHSALREGWDNPNVFQICTLSEAKSQYKKRQEIGRGLRLPVNRKGERVRDERVNRLTVIANESYEDFARKLQAEFEEDFGLTFGRVDKVAFSKLVRPSDADEQAIGQDASKSIWDCLLAGGYLTRDGEVTEKFDPRDSDFELVLPDDLSELGPAIIDTVQSRLFKSRVVNAKERRVKKFNKHVQLNPEFEELWNRLKHSTRYRVQFDTDELIDKAVQRVNALDPIQPVRLSVTRVGVDITEAGVEAERTLEQRTQEAAPVQVLPDLLAYLQKETELTRHTLFQILKRSSRLDEFRINPQEFMTRVGREISRALHDLILEGIQYEKQSSQEWEMSRIEPGSEAELTRYLNELHEAQDKSPADFIDFETEVEKEFAKDLDNNQNVKFFVKLPRWFKVDTPIGTYNPDWAFVTEREQRLYFVRDTRGKLVSREQLAKEKSGCGQRQLEALDADRAVVTPVSDVKL